MSLAFQRAAARFRVDCQQRSPREENEQTIALGSAIYD